jgi:hypothetical protein
MTSSTDMDLPIPHVILHMRKIFERITVWSSWLAFEHVFACFDIEKLTEELSPQIA